MIRYAWIAYIIVLVAVGAFVPCTAFAQEPIPMGVHADNMTVSACETVTWTAVASDSDHVCVEIGCDNITGITISPSDGWAASALNYDGCVWFRTFTRTFNQGGQTLTYTFAADDADIYKREDDAPASYVATLTVKDKWYVAPAISWNGIQSPIDGTTVCAGTEVTCTAGEATDNDTKNCDSGISVADACTYTWSANGGAFKNGLHTGRTVTWIAPSGIGACTITATVDDGNNTNLPPGDYGSRDDSWVISSVQVNVAKAKLISVNSSLFGEGRSAIMTGGASNSVHKTTITATLEPADAVAGEYVSFTVLGSTGVNIPAAIVDVTPVDANGKATATLISSDKDQETITVQASFENQTKTVNVPQATGVYSTFVCDPSSLTADGESTSTIRFCLVQDGATTPAPGHGITFAIDSIMDWEGNPVTGPPWPSQYGTITQPNAVTGADGFALGTFQVGTEPATINIKAEDNNDQVP